MSEQQSSEQQQQSQEKSSQQQQSQEQSSQQHEQPKSSSSLIQDDKLTNSTYETNKWSAASDSNLSFTSARVCVPVYNEYTRQSGSSSQKVIGFINDRFQFDERLDNGKVPGRGRDLMNISPFSYDTIVFTSAGIYGDKGVNKDIINKSATDFKRTMWQPVFTDSFGDVASGRNVGFEKNIDNPNFLDIFKQDQSQGVLGGLRKLKDQNKDLVLSFSIGGWYQSEAFHWIASDNTKRVEFVKGVVDIVTRYPMFSEILLDWEYPAVESAKGNTFFDTDVVGYCNIVKDLKASLAQANRSDVRINITAIADVEKLKKANVPSLMEAGVSCVYLNTLDFFGLWSPNGVLAHHTNMSSYEGPKDYSVESAVNYLESVKVPLEHIHIGTASYTRNAKSAKIDSVSPLKGSFVPGSGMDEKVVGTFESGSFEYYDVLFNYLDMNNRCGKNGFELYTDTKANADFLYNPSNKVFITLDTPRSVKAKSEYVKSRGLGGVFNQSIDMDHGILVNSIKEGLGLKCDKTVIEMKDFYFQGKTSL
eukprot:gene5209-6487_t